MSEAPTQEHMFELIAEPEPDYRDLVADIMAAIKDRVNLWPRSKTYRLLILELRHYADVLDSRDANQPQRERGLTVGL